MYQFVVGRGVMIVGDLHISDRAVVGKHKNYLKNCFDCLAKIRDRVQETKPSAVVFLGDLVGTSERNIKSREVLAMFCSFFQDISKYAKVFCVRGNHDSGDYPEFEFLSVLGLFETSETCDGFFDYYGTEEQRQRSEPEVRFHLVDYGCERKELRIKGGNTTDIVLAHNNFTIQGVTVWYQSHDGIELSTLDNMQGVYMVISGHIHTPSPEIVATEMQCGGTCCLFYAGSPTRPAERYDSCWFVEFAYSEENGCTDYQAVEFPLEQCIFFDDDFVEDMSEDEIAELERKENLKEVLDEIMCCRISNGDLISQVYNIPNASEDAKRVASHYLQIALDNSRVQ